MTRPPGFPAPWAGRRRQRGLAVIVEQAIVLAEPVPDAAQRVVRGEREVVGDAAEPVDEREQLGDAVMTARLGWWIKASPWVFEHRAGPPYGWVEAVTAGEPVGSPAVSDGIGSTR